MTYKIIPTFKFSRELKRLVKKYPSLKQEYQSLIDQLEKDPTSGTSIGNNCHKIRIAIASKGKGKRGGGRVISLSESRLQYNILVNCLRQIRTI